MVARRKPSVATIWGTRTRKLEKLFRVIVGTYQAWVLQQGYPKMGELFVDDANLRYLVQSAKHLGRKKVVASFLKSPFGCCGHRKNVYGAPCEVEEHLGNPSKSLSWSQVSQVLIERLERRGDAQAGMIAGIETPTA